MKFYPCHEQKFDAKEVNSCSCWLYDHPFCPDQQGATTNAGLRRTPASLPFRDQKAVSRIFVSRTILGLIENAKAKINVLFSAKFPV